MSDDNWPELLNGEFVREYGTKEFEVNECKAALMASEKKSALGELKALLVNLPIFVLDRPGKQRRRRGE